MPTTATTAPAAGGKKKKKKKTVEEAPEPKPRWGKSKARKLLCVDIIEGRVPRKAKDDANKSTMKLSDIYSLRPEYKQYHYSKFSSRLSSLRKTIAEREARVILDKEAFDDYVSKHPVNYITHKGYIQWQGSDAQELALEDMANNVHNTKKWAVWHGERREFHKHFPLSVFKDKIRQEIKTAKHLHTLEVRGKDTRKTKDMTNEPLDGQDVAIPAWL